MRKAGADMDDLFQSTHPVRGATRGHDVGDEITAYFNPRTP